MKKKPIIIAFIAVLGISSVLYGLRFVDSETDAMLKDCLFRYVSKCGYIDGTEEKIFEEINNLGLSKKKAKGSSGNNFPA